MGTTYLLPRLPSWNLGFQVTSTSSQRSVETLRCRCAIVSAELTLKNQRSSTDEVVARRKVRRPDRLRESDVQNKSVWRSNAYAVHSSLPVNFLETRNACIVSANERPTKGSLSLKHANLAQVTEDNIRMKTDGVFTLNKIVDVIKMLQPRPDALMGQYTIQSFLNINAHKEDDPLEDGGASGSAPSVQDDSQSAFMDG